VADVSNNGQAHCFFIEALGRRRASDTTTVLAAGVLGDRYLPSGWATRKQVADTPREVLDVFAVELSALFGLACLSPSPSVTIRETFLLGNRQRSFFYQHALAFIVFACAAPFQHYRGECRVLTRAPSESGLAGRQKRKMVQICRREAQGAALAGQHDPRLLP